MPTRKAAESSAAVTNRVCSGRCVVDPSDLASLARAAPAQPVVSVDNATTRIIKDFLEKKDK